MKVRPSVKKICKNCKVVRRRGIVYIICSSDAAAQAAARLSATASSGRSRRHIDIAEVF